MAEKVLAEMVANVLNINVAEGESVRPGQPLILLESMKMEIPVVPEAGGKVCQILVQPGDVVQEGDVLVVLE